MADKGILVSPNTTLGLTTSWQRVLCTSVPATTPGLPAESEGFCNAQAPSAPFNVKIEADLSIVGGATAIYFLTTYDTGATKTCDGPSGACTIANPTGTVGNASCLVGTTALWPTGTTPGNLYVWVKVDNVGAAATLAAKGLRVVYTDRRGG